MSPRRTLSCVLVLASGCLGIEDPGTAPYLAIDRTIIPLGAPVLFSLVNPGADTARFWRCCELAVGVDSKEGSVWRTRTPGICLAVCRMDPVIVPPHSSLDGAKTIGVTGQFRIRVGRYARPDSLAWDVVSSRFEIR